MSDLFTHYASARLASAGLRSPDAAAFVVSGTLLPDLVSKGLYWILRAHPDFDDPSHSILGLALLCFIASLFTPERDRPRTWAALFVGALLHVLVDLFKDNLGAGSARPFLPFSTVAYEFGWIDPEDVILAAPLGILAVGLARLIERRTRRSP
jgi:membrane-bound metal-dependent hydrolase YbcI (DUF457 family)